MMLLTLLIACASLLDGEEPFYLDEDDDGASPAAGDCDDAAASVTPGTEDIPGDGVDQNCDGLDVAVDTVDGYTSPGPWDSANAGARLAAGDLDGDGYAELLVSVAWDPLQNEGPAAPPTELDRVSGVFAVRGPITGDWSLRDHPLFTQGVYDDMPYFGLRIVAPGDMDGDGLGDFAFSIPDGDLGYDTPDVFEAGKVYVIDGPGLDENGQDLPPRSIVGTVDRGRLGASLETGDLDGDGVPDLLVTSPGFVGDEGTTGALLLFSGPIGSEWSEDDAEAWILGELDTGDQGDMLSVGDWDGDGHLDAVVGVPEGSGAVADAGLAWVTYGPLEDGLLADAGASVSGEASEDDIGRLVANAGDIDGDGVDELIAGSPLYDTGDDPGENDGALWLFADAPAGSVSVSTASARFGGLGVRDVTGYAVAPAGDTDGDGMGDLLVSAPQAWYDRFARVSLYLSPFEGDRAPEDADWIGVSPVINDELGMAIIADQDLTGDRQADLVLGAPADSQTESAAGRVVVVPGG